jgi:hypothetical protein
MRGEWVTVLLTFLMGIVGIVLWSMIARPDANVLVSALIVIGMMTLIVCAFHGGFSRGLLKVMDHWFAVAFCITGLITSHATAAITSGDWGNAWRETRLSPSNLSSLCIPIGDQGWLHIHHWLEGLGLLAIVARIIVRFGRLYDGSDRYRREAELWRMGRRLAVIGGALMLAGIVLQQMHYTDSRRSLWAIFVWIGAFIGIFLGGACLSREYYRCTFRTCLAIGLGISLGVTSTGVIEALQELIPEKRVPSTIIFYTYGPGSRCGK